MTRSTIRFILALISLGVGAGICAALIFVQVPDGNRDALLFALGLVLAWGGMALSFYFGTSQSSADKTDLLADRPTGVPGDPVHVEDDG